MGRKKDRVITQEELKRVLDYDPLTGDFTWLVHMSRKVRAGAKAGYVDKVGGYLQIRIHRILYTGHRLAWLYVKGVWPPDQIDHINHVKTDNRIANLRAVTSLENHRNRSLNKNNTSNQNGVSWHERDGKWQARIHVNGKAIYLGGFTHQADAIAARKAAEIKYGFHKNHGKSLDQVRLKQWAYHIKKERGGDVFKNIQK